MNENDLSEYFSKIDKSIINLEEYHKRLGKLEMKFTEFFQDMVGTAKCEGIIPLLRNEISSINEFCKDHKLYHSEKKNNYKWLWQTVIGLLVGGVISFGFFNIQTKIIHLTEKVEATK